MAYVRTNWVNDTPPPIDAVNLNNIETGLLDIHTRYDAHDHSPGDPAQVDGGDVINTPAGGIVAVTVQAAINELDGEKAGIADIETISGDWTHTGVAIFDALKKAMGIRNAAEYDSIQDALDDLP